jgi:predicted TPR repeat methyltransferase
VDSPGEDRSIEKNPTHSREDAAEYDQQAAEHPFHGHAALFGLMSGFVKPGDTLLDIGIGTGLSSIPFHDAGLEVYGFDSSEAMLEVCESKGFAKQLVVHDLRNLPFPYAHRSFDHMISLGVLNFYGTLAPVIAEAARIIKPGGVLGFSVEEQKPGQEAEYLFPIDPGSAGSDAVSIRTYRHSDRHVRELLASSGFTVLKDCEFLADRHPETGIEVYFKAYVARKTQ